MGQHISTLGEDASTGPTQQEILRTTIEKGEWRGEVTNYRTDGSALILDCRTSLVRNSDGKPVALCGISTDITERKRFEESILQERDFSNAALNSLPGIFYLFDRNRHFMRWNTYFETVSGYSSDEISRLTPQDLFRPEDLQLIEDTISEVFEKGEAHVEADFVSKSGEATPYYFTGALILVEGEPCVVGMGIDTSTFKQVQETMAESEQRMELVLKGADLGTWDWDIPTGRVTFNPRWAEMLGYDLKEFEPSLSTWEKLVHPEDLPETMLTLNAHLQGETESYESEFRMRHKSGHWVWILDSGRVFKRDAEGNPLRACGTHLDITKRKQVEEELLRSRDQLKQQTELLAATNRELDKFTQTVSHDLQAPLRRISGWIQILKDEETSGLEDKQFNILNRIADNSQEMQQLVDALLTFSRNSRGEIERVEVDLSVMAREILEGLKEDSPQRKVETLIEDDVRGLGDPRLLKQVLRNLLRNAWKFTQREEVAKIEFGTTKSGASRAFYVRDNGVGFDPAATDKLFTAFQRLHSESDFEGQGIGLAICQRIIHRHGGTIWAEGREGEGAAFYFTL